MASAISCRPKGGYFMPTGGRLFHILGGGHGLDQHGAEFAAVIAHLLKCFLGNAAGAEQKLQPVFGFVRFFERDLKFGNKVGFALGVLRLPDVGADAGAAAADLIGDDRLFLLFELLYQSDNGHGKIHRELK